MKIVFNRLILVVFWAIFYGFSATGPARPGRPLFFEENRKENYRFRRVTLTTVTHPKSFDSFTPVRSKLVPPTPIWAKNGCLTFGDRVKNRGEKTIYSIFRWSYATALTARTVVGKLDEI